MITLRIWLRWNTNTAALEKLGVHVEESRHGRLSVHVTHPHCSPLIHLLPKEAVEEVELHDYSVDELAIADGARTCRDTVLCAISAEATWFDGKTHLIQHIVARGKSIHDVMGLYSMETGIAAEAKELERAVADAAGEGMGTARPSRQAPNAPPSTRPWTPEDKIPN